MKIKTWYLMFIAVAFILLIADINFKIFSGEVRRISPLIVMAISGIYLPHSKNAGYKFRAVKVNPMRVMLFGLAGLIKRK